MWAGAQLGKVWERIKGGFKKVFGFVKNILPIAKTILPSVLPGPIGAGAAAVLNVVDGVTTAVSGIANSNRTTALQEGETPDVFEITPQVRVCDMSKEFNSYTALDGYVDPYGPDVVGANWQDGEKIEFPVDSVGSNLMSRVSLQPLLQGPLGAESNPIQRCYQSRLKIRFRKTGNINALRQYKSVLRIGTQQTFTNPE